MGTLLQDLKYGLRMLARNPGFTCVALLILGLGIGILSTALSVVNAILYRTVPFEGPDRLVAVYERHDRQRDWGWVSYPDYLDCKEQTQAMERMAAYAPESVNLSGAGEPEHLMGLRISPDFFPVLGLAPAQGRLFSPEEYRPAGSRVLVLSYPLWQRRFGGRPDAGGQRVTINGESYTVVGVLPQRYTLIALAGAEPQFLIPFVPKGDEKRDVRHFGVVARLKPHASLESARADFDLVAQRLAQEYSRTNAGWHITVEGVQPKPEPVAYILMVVLILSVLGIACTNVTNLLLARGVAREREIAVRAALGGGMRRVVRQLMTESMLLVFLGTCAGVVAAVWARDLIKTLSAGTVVGLLDVRLDARVLAAITVLFILGGVLVGLGPALQVAQVNLSQALKEGGQSLAGTLRRRRLMSALVVAQLALSTLLLLTTCLVIKHRLRLWQVDPGYRSAGVLTMGITLSAEQYSQDQKRIVFLEQLLARLEGRPGIVSAGLTTALPTHGPTLPFYLLGQPKAAPGEEPRARFAAVSPHYFRTLTIPLRSGRFFAAQDQENSPRVAIVNEAFVAKHVNTQTPLGVQVEVAGALRTIVGVIGDLRSVPLSIEPHPEIYVPYPQSPSGHLALVVATAASNPVSLAGTVKEEVWSLDPNQPVSQIRTMKEVQAADMGIINLGSTLMAALALGSLLMAGVGIDGVLSYSVSQRRAEIGIRMALGARAMDILRLILGHGLRLTVLGVVPGMVGAYAVGRMLGSRLFGLRPAEPLLFAGIILLLVAVALAACYLPARRATKVDPMVALRYE